MNPLILHADHLLTMNSTNDVITDAGVLIGPDGSIGMVGAGVLRAPEQCFAEAFEAVKTW